MRPASIYTLTVSSKGGQCQVDPFLEGVTTVSASYWFVTARGGVNGPHYNTYSGCSTSSNQFHSRVTLRYKWLLSTYYCKRLLTRQRVAHGSLISISLTTRWSSAVGTVSSSCLEFGIPPSFCQSVKRMEGKYLHMHLQELITLWRRAFLDDHHRRPALDPSIEQVQLHPGEEDDY